MTDNIPHVLKFSSEAYQQWKAFQREIEAMMRPGGRLETTTDLGGKMPGQAARIAGLMHVAEYASDATNHLTIGADTMRRALIITRVCLEHALHVFGLMGVDDSLAIARRLWAEAAKLDKPHVTAREIWQQTRGKYPTMASVEKGFDALVERGWLIEQTEDHRGRGRPARKFLVNPKAANCAHIAHANGSSDTAPDIPHFQIDR